MTRPDQLPLVQELVPVPEAEDVFVRLAALRHCVFLDSALPHPVLGRYSFVAADPFLWFQCAVEESDALGQLAALVEPFCAETVAGLPPFQGGAAGLLSYDLGRQLEPVPASGCDEFGLPALAAGLYDTVIAWDHAQGRAWIISQGFPELGKTSAQQRLAQFRQWLSGPARARACAGTTDCPAIAEDQLAPQYPVAGLPGLTSNFSEASYLRAVSRAIEYVYAGDVFQVNLAQRLLCPARQDSVALYCRLRRCNPATFAAYFDLGEFQILSASPERFLKASGGWVESRPIKGTRPRYPLPEADLAAQHELCQSPKDRAENVMIVDLLRNDLSRVCRPESVCVTQLCGLETYPFVHHLVSVICAQLRPDRTWVDLLRAAFPGGSVTGAPKVRAMQIIAELEPTARGAYCGSLGYIGFDGSMDLNILIRTITAGQGWWQAHVGGGIVAQSSPQAEYAETWDKARGLVRAML